MSKYSFLLFYSNKYIVLYYNKRSRIKGLYFKNGIVPQSKDCIFKYDYNINLKERHLKLLMYII
jgi:hypothetical protein